MDECYQKYAKLRDQAGLTDYKVAKLAGFSQATLTEWKQGKYKPKLDKIAKIAAVIGCSVHEIEEPTQIDIVINDKESGEVSVVSLESETIKATQLQRLMAYASVLSDRDRSIVLDMASKMAADRNTKATLTGIHAAEAYEELRNKHRKE